MTEIRRRKEEELERTEAWNESSGDKKQALSRHARPLHTKRPVITQGGRRFECKYCASGKRRARLVPDNPANLITPSAQ